MYNYEKQKPFIFTEDGQKMFLNIRDRTQNLLDQSGVVRCDKMTKGCTGDSWNMLACVDRLVEIGEIFEVEHPHSKAGQFRLFIGKSS